MESILILTGIWAFALITGLGSSILRAAVMFSLFRLQNCLKRKMIRSTPYLHVDSLWQHTTRAFYLI